MFAPPMGAMPLISGGEAYLHASGSVLNLVIMLTQSSYRLSRFAVDEDKEKQRLNGQVDLFWAQELELYRRLGLRAGMKLLDCGCGTGHLLQKLRSEIPGIDCTGIDQDAHLLGVAQANLGNSPDFQWVQCSACKLELPDDSFDFVIARLVLEHLPEPGSALKEILRVLKPSGRVVIIDNDFDMHERTWPDCPSLEPLYEAYRTARIADGGNPCIGRELPRWLTSSGFADVSLTLLAAHSQLQSDEAFLKAEGSGIPAQLVKDGYLPPAILNNLAEEWVRMLGTPGHSIFRMLFASAGRKPAEVDGTVRHLEGASVLASRPVPSLAETQGEDASPLSTPDDIRRFMQNVLAEDMEVSADSLPFGESLLHLGVNSLAAMRLCNQIKSRLQLSISMADVLCGKSIEELTQQVLVLMQNDSSNRLIEP